MEKILKTELNTSVLKAFGSSGGGYISQSQGYETDSGRVFVKINHKPQEEVLGIILRDIVTSEYLHKQLKITVECDVSYYPGMNLGKKEVRIKARKMFEGEMASLEAIQKTNIVRVPQPIKVIDLPGGGAMFVMEYLKMKHLNKYSSKLGEQIADLHLYNQKLGEKLRKEGNTIGKGAGHSESQYVDKFGFHTATCCGYIPQVNEWQSDWPSFFIHHRLQAQLDLIEKDYGDREARELWSQLKLKIPEMFRDVEIVPALLHGDLWAGNVAEDDSGPVIFDPASFYGHSEFELAIAGMFENIGNENLGRKLCNKDIGVQCELEYMNRSMFF